MGCAEIVGVRRLWGVGRHVGCVEIVGVWKRVMWRLVGCVETEVRWCGEYGSVETVWRRWECRDCTLVETVCAEIVECARVGNKGVRRLWRLWLCVCGGSRSRSPGVFQGTGIRVGCAETHPRVAVPRADSRSGPVLRRVIRIAASQQAPN